MKGRPSAQRENGEGEWGIEVTPLDSTSESGHGEAAWEWPRSEARGRVLIPHCFGSSNEHHGALAHLRSEVCFSPPRVFDLRMGGSNTEL